MTKHHEDERISAWNAVAEHPLFASCYDEGVPLLSAMIAKLDLHAKAEEEMDAPDDRVIWADGKPVGFYHAGASIYVYFDNDGNPTSARITEPARLRWLANQIEAGEPFPEEQVTLLADLLKSSIAPGKMVRYEDVAVTLLRKGVSVEDRA